jgi:hypothetical protein
MAGVTIPGLGADLIAVHDAWRNGTLTHTEPRWVRMLKYAAITLGVALVLGFGWRRLRSRR